MKRWARLVLRAYPPYFIARYGAELEALIEDAGGAHRHLFDLLRGAARAWLVPHLAGDPRRRLQATVATTWVAWCAGFLVVPAVDRALLDPPVVGVSSSVQALLDASIVLLIIGWAVALVGVV